MEPAPTEPHQRSRSEMSKALLEVTPLERELRAACAADQAQRAADAAARAGETVVKDLGSVEASDPKAATTSPEAVNGGLRGVLKKLLGLFRH